MLKPERMKFVQILVRNEDARETIEELARIRLLHVRDHKKQNVGESVVDIGRPAENARALSDALTKARSLMSSLTPSEIEHREPETIGGRIARVEALAQRYAEHEDRLTSIHASREEIENQKRLLDILPDPESPLETLFNARSVETFLVEKQDSTSGIPALVRKETKTHALLTIRKGNGHRILESGCVPIDISALEGLHGMKSEVTQELEKRARVLERHEEQEKEAMQEISTHYVFLKNTERVLALELLKAQAPLHFGSTKHVTLIKGYVPASRLDELRQISGVHTVSTTHEAPTKLTNPRPLKDFEALINIYTLPRYNEIDPTSLIAITFPLFFGFMLGDIGYGLMLLAAFWLIGKRWPATQGFSNIIIISAIATMFFGLLFGEFFGLEQVFGIHLPSLLHRATELDAMFAIALVLGVMHINIGLFFGMHNIAVNDGWMHGIIEKGSWVLLQIGAIMAAAGHGLLQQYTAWQPSPIAGWVVLALAISGIAYTENLQGLLEMPMIFSHTLSYLRLVAIGLASISMAMVTNDLGGQIMQSGTVWILPGVLVIIIGHTINLALGLLGPFLHSLRLHYAEFFMKFYTGGGIEYRPFGEVNT